MGNSKPRTMEEALRQMNQIMEAKRIADKCLSDADVAAARAKLQRGGEQLWWGNRHGSMYSWVGYFYACRTGVSRKGL
jgi:hypothetical protein